MGYYYFFSDGTIEQGTFGLSDVAIAKQDSTYAMSNLSRHNDVIQTPAPFQLILMSFDPAAQMKTRVTVMSPGNYNYVEYEYSSFEMHHHNTFELVYIQEGTMYQRIESERHIYPAGSFLILNRNVRHCEETDTAFRTVSLSLSADYFKAMLQEDRDQVFKTGHLWGDNTDLQEFLSAELQGSGSTGKSYIDFIPLNPQNAERDPIEDLFEKMTMIMLRPKPGDVFTFRAHICQLLNLLCRRDLFTTRPISLGTQSEGRIFSQITTLMEEYNGRISRELLVEKLSYSGSYLNHIVQTFTGMNITQYALHHLLKRAAWLLVNTDHTITDIVSELGFSNRSYFYKEFQKHYDITPRAYRLQNKKQ